MKQAIQDVRTGEIAVVEVPDPRPAPGQALVATRASVISPGTERGLAAFAGKSMLGKARSRPDLVQRVLEKASQEGLVSTFESVRSRLDQPMPIGYSSSGIVQEAGSQLGRFSPGQRVICAGGGYAVHAEKALVPRNLLAPLPDNVTFEEGAFGTLAGIVVHGLRLAQVQVGERVAVIGLGLLGQLALRLVSAAGALPWGVDLAPARVSFARSAGYQADERAHALEAAWQFTNGFGFDSVLILASSESSDPIELAGEIARDRAKIIAIGEVGLDIPRRLYYEKELELTVSRAYGPGRYDPEYEEQGHDYPIGYVRWTVGRNLQAVADLLAAGKLKVDDLITHRFAIDDAPEAYRVLRDAPEKSLAILLDYPDAAGPGPRKVRIRDGEGKTNEGMVRVGVLGAGNFAMSTALPAMRRVPGLDLVGIVSRSGLSSASAARRYGFEYAASRVEDLLQDERIDVLAIFSRHNQHLGQIIAGLEAGKHVFCEKPPALTPDELDELANALHGSAGQVFSVGYNRRFAPLSLTLQEFVSGLAQPCAMIYRVNAGGLPADHWLLNPEVGGGRLVGECGHFFDLMGALAGSEPVEIHASRIVSSGSDPGFTVQVSYRDGSIGTLVYSTSGSRRTSKERLEYFGSGRSAILDNFRTLVLASGNGRRVKRHWLRQDKGHRAIWERFALAVRDQQPPIDPADLISTSAITFAAQASIEQSRSVALHEFLPA